MASGSLSSDQRSVQVSGSLWAMPSGQQSATPLEQESATASDCAHTHPAHTSCVSMPPAGLATPLHDLQGILAPPPTTA